VPGATTLSQVIEMAGGFSAFASLNGSYIRRPDDPLALRPDIQVIDPKAGIATSTLTLDDTTRFMFDQQLQQNLVSADFVAIFTEGDRTRDVILHSGDVIVVPRELGQVFVRGRVEHPGWVHYVPGKDFLYYITMAGGYTEAAADERVVVEKFGTGIWNDVCCTPIESGDQIYVPGERDTPARTALERASTILAIVASVLLIADTFINIFNKLFPDEP
jgi:protein involved in polysaccharide export with SLBB domain